MIIMPPLDPRTLMFNDSHGYAVAHNNAPDAKPKGGLTICLQTGHQPDSHAASPSLGATIAIEPVSKDKYPRTWAFAPRTNGGRAVFIGLI